MDTANHIYNSDSPFTYRGYFIIVFSHIPDFIKAVRSIC